MNERVLKGNLNSPCKYCDSAAWSEPYYSDGAGGTWWHKNSAGDITMPCAKLWMSNLVPGAIAEKPAERPQLSAEKVRGALARGYCHKSNSYKVLDSELCEAMKDEIIALLTGVEEKVPPVRSNLCRHPLSCKRCGVVHAAYCPFEPIEDQVQQMIPGTEAPAERSDVERESCGHSLKLRDGLGECTVCKSEPPTVTKPLPWAEGPASPGVAEPKEKP